MPSYDSDSSSGDEGDYTTTNVTLGYATTESTGDDISHLGGFPSWLNPETSPPAALAKCKICNGYLSLLLQLNADLAQHFPNDERRLHVLCCRKKTCSKKIGSVRAIREVRKGKSAQPREKQNVRTPAVAEQKPAPDLGSALFGGSTSPRENSNANPFATSSLSSQTTSANPFASVGSLSGLAAIPPQQPVNDEEPPTQSFADKLKITVDSQTDSMKTQASKPQEPWPPSSEFPSPFSILNLDAYPEELEPENPTSEQSNGPSKSQYDTDDTNNNSTSAALDKDNFESTLDKTFQKFSDRIAQNPEQVLRYEFKGYPLLYSGADGVASRFVVPHGKTGAVRGIPRCEKCGSQRVFEVQLVPGLIYELEKDEVMDLEEGMEWGTIIAGTCVNNCGEAGNISFREEWVGVQWEERVAKK